MFIRVVVKAESRESFQLKRKSYREIVRADAMLTHAEGERAGPTAEVAVKGVILFFQNAVARLEMVRDARGPVLVEFVIKAVENGVVIRFQPKGWTASKIMVAHPPAPG